MLFGIDRRRYSAFDYDGRFVVVLLITMISSSIELMRWSLGYFLVKGFQVFTCVLVHRQPTDSVPIWQEYFSVEFSP